MTATKNMRNRLLLIDGHGVAYRQFFALQKVGAFTTSSGEPTSATYGFARTILDILQADPAPRFLAVTFDQGLSGREIAYPEYKGTREKMDDSLRIQMDRIRELVQAFNIPILEKDGYEADDVIGSAARQAVAMGVDVYVLTGDADILQLVDDHTLVEQQQIKGSQIYDVEGVMQRFGLRPEQIPDYKALVGDNSDNIPGVAGIGEKTAVPLLQQYGTVETLYEHLAEQKESIRRKLEQGRDSAFLSKHLAKILTDIPLDLDLNKCLAHDYDHALAGALFEKLEFNSLGKRLKTLDPAEQLKTSPKTGSKSAKVDKQQLSMFGSSESETPSDGDSPVIAPVPHLVNTIVVDSDDSLADLIATLAAAPAIAFDTETTSTDQMRAALVGISLAVNGETAYYIPVGHTAVDGVEPRQLPVGRIIEALRPAMTDPGKAKYAHHAAYDLIMLRRYGLDVKPITFDTMLGAWLIRPEAGHKGLKDQARIRLNVEMTEIGTLIGKRGKNQLTMDAVPIERAAPYAAADAAMTYRLVEPIRADLEKAHLLPLFTELEMPLMPVICDLDMTGTQLDLPYLAELSLEFNARLDARKEQIYEAVGERFNVGSLKQLNDILFNKDKLGLDSKALRKSAHGVSLDSDALETLRDQHPVISMIADWRGLEKLKSTYVDAFPVMVDETGRIHTSYNQAGSVTGRISSDTPNLQNIPIRTEEGRRVRKAFIAAPGSHLLSVDYSQIELRILAHYSGDPFLTDAFEHDQDIHKATAAAVTGVPFDQVTKDQRYFAKRVNFGLLYGMGARRLVRESGELTRLEAQTFIDRYFERLAGVKAYLDNSKKLAYDQGYLETLLGRRRDFSALNGLNLNGNDRARMEGEAINMPIQGTAADIIKIAMIRLSARLKAEHSRARLILQVHDELVLEVPDEDLVATANLVKQIMESAVTLNVPLRADANIGLNWAEMQPLDEWIAAHA